MVDLNTLVYPGLLYNKLSVQASLEKRSITLTHIQKFPYSHTLSKFFFLNQTLITQGTGKTENPMYLVLDKMKDLEFPKFLFEQK